MTLVQQFLKSFRQSDDLEPGIFLKNDGTVWLRNPDGSETQLPGGGGGNLPDPSDQPDGSLLQAEGGVATWNQFPGWQDISGDIVVSRVVGSDSNPDISVLYARALAMLGGLTVVQFHIEIGSGGAGSGISPYILENLGNLSASDPGIVGTGIFFETGAGKPLFRASLLYGGPNEVLILWDGSSSYGTRLGPASSTNGGPFNFAAGDTLFNGQLIIETPA